MKLIGYRQVSSEIEGQVYHGYRLFLIGQFTDKETTSYGAVGQKVDFIKWVKVPIFEDFLKRCADKGIEPFECEIDIFYDQYKKPTFISIVQ